MLRPLALAALLLLPIPAIAQDEMHYTSGDADILGACVDDANQDASDGDGGAGWRACIGVASNACQEEPQGASTVGITACNYREANWWDAQLNAEYASLKDGLDADTFAIGTMLTLGRSPKAMGELMFRVTGKEGDKSPSILSSHPLTEDRLARMSREDRPPSGPPLLTAEEWTALKSICSSGTKI